MTEFLRQIGFIQRGVIYLTLVVGCLLIPYGASLADETLKIAFIGKSENKKQQNLIEQTQLQLQRKQVSVAIDTHTSSTFFNRPKKEPDYDLLVAIGSKVTQQLQSELIATPIISIFISSIGYTHGPLPQHTAIFIDQPPSRYLSLIKEILPHSNIVSLLYSDYSDTFYQQLRQAATQQQFQINGQKVSSESDIYSALDNAVKNSDVLLAIPDPNIYNRRTIKTIFLTSYQDEIPIIGFSGSYTTAGAISSLHSTIPDIAKQLAESIVYFIQNGRTLPASSYPHYFHISTNRKVANSLSITLDEPEALQKKITKQGHGTKK